MVKYVGKGEGKGKGEGCGVWGGRCMIIRKVPRVR